MTNQTVRDKATPRQSNGSASALALAGAASATIANFGIVIALNSASTTTAGIFFAATSVITILGNSSSLGTMTGLVYFMPQVTTDGSDNPRSLLKVALAPVVACGTLFALGIAALAPTIGELIADDGAAEIARMLRILAIAIPAWAITMAALGGTRALGSMTPTAAIGRVFRPAGQVGLMGSVALFSDDPTPTKFAVAWGLPVVVAACASLVALQRLGGFHHHGTASVSQREFWAFTRPRSASTALQIALERVDVILVSALAPLAGIQGELAAGIYGTLSRFITAANFLVASLTQAVTPKIRRALAKNKTTEAQRLIDQTSGWMVMLVWPYLLIVAIRPTPLLELVTTPEDAAMGANALIILALGVLLSPAAGPADGTLLMLGHSGWSLLGIAAAIVVDVGLAVALIPPFGITGAAIAWVVAVAVANGLPLFLTNRLGGLRPSPGRPVFIAAVCAVVAVVPIGFATPNSLVGMFSTMAVAGVVMAGLVFRFARDLSVPVNKIPVLRNLFAS